MSQHSERGRSLRQAVHSGADLDAAVRSVMGYDAVSMKGKRIRVEPVAAVATPELGALLDAALEARAAAVRLWPEGSGRPCGNACRLDARACRGPHHGRWCRVVSHPKAFEELRRRPMQGRKARTPRQTRCITAAMSPFVAAVRGGQSFM